MPLNEGQTVQYTVTTTRVPDGTTLYWKTTGNTTNSDITGGNTGTITVTNNQAVFNVTMIADETTEGTKTLGIAVTTGSQSGPTVVTTPTPIVVNDTSTTPFTVNYLLVAGGGAGGAQTGGGGGAGGYLTGNTTSLALSTPYTITIGAGGTGQTYSRGLNGANTSINSLFIAVAGGGAGARYNGVGSDGGSGGGAAENGAAFGLGISGQGNNGASGLSALLGGGGGGANAAADGRLGGAGRQWFNGNYYAGGGTGSQGAAEEPGGIGGGGTGNYGEAQPNSAGGENTGGGGGGVQNPVGGAGGSGIAILRYLGTPVATGGTITQTGGYTYHTFTSSDTFTLN
jgi:hypothetical protein